MTEKTREQRIRTYLPTYLPASIRWRYLGCLVMTLSLAVVSLPARVVLATLHHHDNTSRTASHGQKVPCNPLGATSLCAD